MNVNVFSRNPKAVFGVRLSYIPSKLQRRLNDYIRDNDIEADERVFPISYSTSWSMVKKAGQIVGTNLRPHLRRHAATYASRAGTPLEIVSKVKPYWKVAEWCFYPETFSTLSVCKNLYPEQHWKKSR